MAEETTQTPPNTSEETEKTKGGAEENKPASDTSQAGDKPKLYTQEDLDRIAGKVRTEEKQRFDKKVTDEKTAAQQLQLKEQGEFKTLYETSQNRVKELESELTGERIKSVKAEVAAEHKLPAALADLLKGETRDELTAHAKELAKVVAPRQAPNSEGGEKPPIDPKKAQEDETKRQQATGRYSAF